MQLYNFYTSMGWAIEWIVYSRLYFAAEHAFFCTIRINHLFMKHCKTTCLRLIIFLAMSRTDSWNIIHKLQTAYHSLYNLKLSGNTCKIIFVLLKHCATEHGIIGGRALLLESSDKLHEIIINNNKKRLVTVLIISSSNNIEYINNFNINDNSGTKIVIAVLIITIVIVV